MLCRNEERPDNDERFIAILSSVSFIMLKKGDYIKAKAFAEQVELYPLLHCNILIKMIIMKTIIKVLYDQPTPIALFVRSEALYNMCEVTDMMTTRRMTMRRMMMMATM